MRAKESFALALIIAVAAGCSSTPPRLQPEQARPDAIPVYDQPAELIDEPVEFTETPVLIHWEQPRYPRLAAQAGNEGIVRIALHIDIDGSVREAILIKSWGTEAAKLGAVPAVFGESAVEAAYSNKYRSAQLHSKPIAIWWAYDIEFYHEWGECDRSRMEACSHVRGPLNEGPAGKIQEKH